jgi:hypothetical protein
MRIDRQNYEEYFILYVDNELNPTQRLLVEEFAQKHPDLEEELVLLYQSRLTPDKNIVFEGKEELLKEESNSFVDPSNYEEALLLYIDNELTGEEKFKIEKLAEQYPQIRSELEILQQTRLQPEEEIVFANKKLLYRSERKVRVITIQFWKIAAAAVLILLIGGVTFIVVNSGDNVLGKNYVVLEKKNQEKVKPGVIVAEPKRNITPVENINHEELTAKAPVVDSKKENSKEQFVVSTSLKTKNRKPQKELKPQEPATNNLPDQNEIVKINIDNSPVSTLNNVIANKNISPSKELVKPMDVVTISNTNPSDNMNNGNKRFRGLLRKATRIFERTTKITATDEDDRLLIGGLAVKL